MKRYIKVIFLLLCLFVWSGALQAKNLNYYLNQLDTHPKVQSVLEQQQALHHQAEGAMGLPDPSLFLGVENVPISDPSFDQYLPSSKVRGFSQNIPYGGTRKAQKEVFLSSASSIELLADYTKSRLYSLFFTRLAELQKVKEQYDYEERKKQIIGQLNDYYEGRIVAGDPVYQETFVIEIELAEVEQKLNSLLAERSTVEADLIQLVGEVPDLDDPQFEEKEWGGELEALYPVLLAARNIDVEQAKVDLAESDYSPDFGVVGTYKFREDGANDSFEGDDWFSLQFRVSIPLWASSNQAPKLEAAKSRKKSAVYGYRESLRRWQMETTRLKSEKHASLLNIGLLQQKVDAQKEKIEALERTYSAGQTSLESVLQAELTNLSLLSQIAALQSKYRTISQELNALIPTSETNDSK